MQTISLCHHRVCAVSWCWCFFQSRPDRYVPLFGDNYYDTSKWRASVPFVEQLRAFQDLINEGKVRYIGVSNETSYGVMEFVHTAKLEGLPKIVSIQNGYSLLARIRFEGSLSRNIESSGIHLVLSLMWPYEHVLDSNVLHSFLCYNHSWSGRSMPPQKLQCWLACLFPSRRRLLVWKILDYRLRSYKNARLNLFPGFMERYKGSLAKVCSWSSYP